MQNCSYDHPFSRNYPFEGRDKYQDDHGNMLIKIGKLLTLQEAKGEAMDRSGLVTILAEAFVLPGISVPTVY
jgi:hypothetical protein